MLLWQFSTPVLIANAIAWPVAWYYLQGWLEGFAYRITLGPLYFVGAGVGALAIAWAPSSSTPCALPAPIPSARCAMNKTHLKGAVCALTLVVLPNGAPVDAKPVAQSCGALREVASLEMTPLADGARVSVPLTINGKRVEMEVDTGAGMSSLTVPAAATLGIKSRDAVGTRLVSQDGTAIRHYYLADDFQLGPLAARKIPFMQGNDIADARLSGTLGPDLMVRYDVEMDFSSRN